MVLFHFKTCLREWQWCPQAGGGNGVSVISGSPVRSFFTWTGLVGTCVVWVIRCGREEEETQQAWEARRHLGATLPFGAALPLQWGRRRSLVIKETELLTDLVWDLTPQGFKLSAKSPSLGGWFNLESFVWTSVWALTGDTDTEYFF